MGFWLPKQPLFESNILTISLVSNPSNIPSNRWYIALIFQIYFLNFFFIKAFLTFTYKIENKEKKEREDDTHTHAYILQTEEYKAKHTQSYFSNSYLVCNRLSSKIWRGPGGYEKVAGALEPIRNGKIFLIKNIQLGWIVVNTPRRDASRYMLWFNFILGSNFLFFCFKLIIMLLSYITIPKNKRKKFEPRIKLNHNIYI